MLHDTTKSCVCVHTYTNTPNVEVENYSSVLVTLRTEFRTVTAHRAKSLSVIGYWASHVGLWIHIFYCVNIDLKMLTLSDLDISKSDASCLNFAWFQRPKWPSRTSHESHADHDHATTRCLHLVCFSKRVEE